MVRLIKLHEIDQFFDTVNIPDAAISETILSHVRQLHEKDELEPLIREVVYDPNETPHGPTEIADLFTSHLIVRGEKRVAAFVIKGRSFTRVRSTDVAHQFLKLRQIPQLGLMVFMAVGHMQDDAQRDFLQTALDSTCDYLIIDAHDLARLLIAYGKICPKDGTPFNKVGLCKMQHLSSESTTIEMQVSEPVRFTLAKHREVSSTAKRYSANVILDRHYSRDVIRELIHKITEELKQSQYYGTERAQAQWRRSPAQVVWLFIAHDLEDIQMTNWVCRSLWVDPNLPTNARPFIPNDAEDLGRIKIMWNENYQFRKEFYERNVGRKEVIIAEDRRIVKSMKKLANKAIESYGRYKAGEIGEEKYIAIMQELGPQSNDLYMQAGQIPIPPVDCNDYHQVCQEIFATIDNMFLWYTGDKSYDRPSRNRDWLFEQDVNRLEGLLEKLRFEEDKLN